MEEEIGGGVVSFLSELLCEPEFLVSGINGDSVSLSELKEKVVGVYFFSTEQSGKRAWLLKGMYIELLKMGCTNFQIVLVCSKKYLHIASMFMEDFDDTPWLALPLLDSTTYEEVRSRFSSKCCPVRRIDDELVIIQPDKEIVHSGALHIFYAYGVEAFPFTFHRITEMVVERFKSLTLESVLFSGQYKYVIGKDGQKIAASDLAGKKILLFLDTVPAWLKKEKELLLEKVSNWYKTTPNGGESCVMIRVRYGEEHPEVENMPWLEFPYDSDYNPPLYVVELEELQHMPLLAAFGPDGQFTSMTYLSELIHHPEDGDTPDFFDDGDFFKIILEKLSNGLMNCQY